MVYFLSILSLVSLILFNTFEETDNFNDINDPYIGQLAKVSNNDEYNSKLSYCNMIDKGIISYNVNGIKCP